MTQLPDPPDRPERPALSPADADALDAVLQQSPASPASPEREARVREWLALLAAAPSPQPPADLADRTLALIERERMKFAPAPAAEPDFAGPVRRRWTRHVAEIGAMAVAASLLLAVVFVGIGQARQSGARTVCATNLKAWATAFQTYGAANSNALPALATPADRNWLHSNDPAAARSNAANLLPLLRTGLVTVANLTCAGDPATARPVSLTGNSLPDIGYSYTYLYGPVRPRWDGSRDTIVLADRNPMFLPGATAAAADRNSANHAGRGTYMLRASGDVTWETSPNVGPSRDNVWSVNKAVAQKAASSKGSEAVRDLAITTLYERVTTYTGAESPADSADAFLVP
jgi:hypothetical protein